MSDADLRDLERRWRSSGAPADGEAWVEAVLRSTGTPTLPMISMLIQHRRLMLTLAHVAQAGNPGVNLRGDLMGELTRPVSPDDIVSFLRGTGEWARDPQENSLDRDVRAMSEIIRGQCSHEQDYTCGRCDPTIDPSDPNAYVPRRPARIGDAVLCEHANEVPGRCPCDQGCYCRQDGNTCSDVRSMDGNPADRQCDIATCFREAEWRLRQPRRVLPYTDGQHAEVLCAEHLAEMRRQDRMSEQAVWRRCRNDDCTRMVPADGASYCSNSCARNDQGHQRGGV